MGDYEAVPSDWSWLPLGTPADVKDAVGKDDGRLISIHRPDGGSDEPYTAVWVANKDDHPWNWTPKASAAELKQAVDNDKGRLIFIDAFNISFPANEFAFAGVWVENSGDYEIDWGWAADMTSSQVRKQAKVSRLICLSPYESNGTRLYAAVWVDNDGANKREWDWSHEISFEDLRERLHDFPGRLVSLDPFMVGSDLRFAAIWVKADDQYAKLWWWELPLDADTVSMNCELYCSHLVEIRTMPGAPNQYAHFRHGFPRPDYNESAALVSVSGTAEITDVPDTSGGFGQTTALDLTLTNMTGGPVEILEAEVVSTYAGWAWPDCRVPMFDGGNAILGGNSTTMVGNAAYAGTASYYWVGVSHMVARVRAQDADGNRQRLVTAIPITRPTFSPPASLKIKAPVYLGLWSNPMEIVRLWQNGAERRWLMIGGAVMNGSGKTLRIGGLHATVELADNIVDARELAYDFRHFAPPDLTVYEAVPPSTDAHATLPSPISYFIDGFELPDDLDLSVGVTVTVVLDYKIGSWCGSASRRVHANLVEPLVARAPVKGTWVWGNGPAHLGYDPHGHPAERFCYDYQIVDANGSTFSGKDDKDNTAFYAYDQEVHAIAPGTVVLHDFTDTAENNGRAGDGDQTMVNFVLLSHQGPEWTGYSGYYHLRPEEPDPAAPMVDGDSVKAGQLIGYVGNSGGSSEPHLHFGVAVIDKTGRPTIAPLGPRRVKTTGGVQITGTPASDQYKS